MEWTSIVAYLIDCLGTLLTQIGYIFMKKGMIKVEQTGLNGSKKKLGFFTWEWILGFFLLCVGSLIHIGALPFCDLVLLSTDTAIGIVGSEILSIFILKEKIVWRYDATAIILIIGGCLTIVFLSSYEPTVYTPDIILGLIRSSATLVFSVTGLIITLLTIVQYTWQRKKLLNFNESSNSYLAARLNQLQSTNKEEADKLISSAGGQSISEVASKERPQRIIIKII